MMYQQCGSLCPQTCDNIGMSTCQGGCAEGCFCPDGQVWSNGECISPVLCQGILYSVYAIGLLIINITMLKFTGCR